MSGIKLNNCWRMSTTISCLFCKLSQMCDFWKVWVNLRDETCSITIIQPALSTSLTPSFIKKKFFSTFHTIIHSSVMRLNSRAYKIYLIFIMLIWLMLQFFFHHTNLLCACCLFDAHIVKLLTISFRTFTKFFHRIKWKPFFIIFC